MTKAQQVVIARPIDSQPQADHFKLEDTEVPSITDGQLLVEVHYISQDPYVGSTLRGRHMGHDAGGIGVVVMGLGVGKVLESKADGFNAGDFVAGEMGWRTHVAIDAETARKVDGAIEPLSLHLGVLGMPGLTAYAGIVHRAKAKAGDHVLISSAAGPVGGTAGQIARIQGAEKVVGIAGSDEKCRMVIEQYGFDDCINYKQANWKDQIATAFPDGINLYWDNVGGELLDTALANLALYGRIVLCGLASQYHATERPVGPNPGTYIGKRAEVYGLVVYDFYGEQQEYAATAYEWIQQGKLAYLEDVSDGIASAPQQFEKLMNGQNVGKTIVKII
jgi:NADPH-dependent curcumin reductase CurA